MKIYIASKWENFPEVRQLQGTLIELGHTITEDWTRSNEVNTPAAAIADYKGIMHADLFIGLFEKEFVYKGAWVEMGIALGFGKEVYLVGDKVPNSCVFSLMPHVMVFPTIQHLIYHISGHPTVPSGS